MWLRAIRVLAELDCLFSLAKASSALGEPACRPDAYCKQFTMSLSSSTRCAPQRAPARVPTSPQHPGGDEVMLAECGASRALAARVSALTSRRAGKDASEAFDDIGHSDEARSLMGPMLVGTFDGPTSVRRRRRHAARNLPI